MNCNPNEPRPAKVRDRDFVALFRNDREIPKAGCRGVRGQGLIAYRKHRGQKTTLPRLGHTDEPVDRRPHPPNDRSLRQACDFVLRKTAVTQLLPRYEGKLSSESSFHRRERVHGAGP
jgi:hypothetical protein